MQEIGLDVDNLSEGSPEDDILRRGVRLCRWALRVCAGHPDSDTAPKILALERAPRERRPCQ